MYFSWKNSWIQKICPKGSFWPMCGYLLFGYAVHIVLPKELKMAQKHLNFKRVFGPASTQVRGVPNQTFFRGSTVYYVSSIPKKVLEQSHQSPNKEISELKVQKHKKKRRFWPFLAFFVKNFLKVPKKAKMAFFLVFLNFEVQYPTGDW